MKGFLDLMASKIYWLQDLVKQNALYYFHMIFYKVAIFFTFQVINLSDCKTKLRFMK